MSALSFVRNPGDGSMIAVQVDGDPAGRIWQDANFPDIWSVRMTDQVAPLGTAPTPERAMHLLVQKWGMRFGWWP